MSMGEEKHTPGPWALDSVFPDVDGYKIRGGSLAFRKGPRLIAVVKNQGERPVVENSLLDARLISSAPELLSALKSLKLECLADVLNPCWDNRPNDIPGLHWGSIPGDPVAACSSCIAKAAIAKAEGRA